MDEVQAKNTEKTQKPRKPRRFLKILGILICGLILLVVILFFYVSSAHFCRHFVFPMAGKKIQRTLQADQIRISPLSRVELTNFTITNPQKPKEPPLVKMGGLLMNYSAFSFLKGAPKVQMISVSEPEANLVLYADGKTNVDDLRAAQKKPPKTAPPKEKAPAKPFTLPNFALKLLEVKNGSIHVTQLDKDENPVRNVSLEKIRFKLTDLEPNQKSKMDLSLNFTMEDKSVQTKIDQADFSFENTLFVSRDLSKMSLETICALKNFSGTFQGNRVEGYEMDASVKMNKEKDVLNLEPFSVVLRKQKEIAARFQASGKYNQKAGEGKFALELGNIDRNLLNLIGSSAGNMDFRDTSISYKGDVAISDQNKKTEMNGELQVKRFSILAPAYSKTPTEELDFSFAHKFSLDKGKNVLTIPTLQIKALQKNREVVTGNLDKPLTLDLSAMKGAAPSAPPIEYSFSVNKFDLTPFLLIAPLPEGTLIKTADLNSSMKIAFQDNGKKVNLKGDASLKNFGGKLAKRDFPQTDFSLGMDINVNDFTKVTIKDLTFLMAQQQGPQNKGRMTGEMDTKSGEGVLRLESLDVDFKTLRPFVPPELVTLDSGTLSAKATIKMGQNFSKYDVNSTANLSGFSCILPQGDKKTRIEMDLASALNLSLDKAGSLQISLLNLDMKTGTKPTGNMQLSGNMDLPKGTGALNLSVKNINQDTVKPFLASLEGMNLESLNVETEQKINLANGFKTVSVSGETSAKDIILKDTKEKKDMIPPLNLKLKNQIEYQEPRVAIRDLTLLAKALNKPEEKISMKGEILMAQKNPTISSKMTLVSDQLTLDNYLPPWLLEQKKKETKTEKTSEAKPAAPVKELEPMDLGFLAISGDVAMKKVSFKEITLTDIQAKINLADSVLDFPQASLKLNNAPFQAKGFIKFNVPGWEYAMNTGMENLDIKPLVNSFAPEYKDQITGTASGKMDVKGQGTTPENLQKYLKGTIKGNLKDGNFSGLPILSSLATVTRIAELETLRFFDGIVDLDIADGKIKIVNLYFKGNYEKLGLKGWFGLDEKIDLSLQLALAAPLNDKIKQLAYVGDLLTDSDGYSELPMPIGMGGTFSDPKPTLKLQSAVKETGKKLLKDTLLKELKKQLK